jgi:hypothetical protein
MQIVRNGSIFPILIFVIGVVLMFIALGYASRQSQYKLLQRIAQRFRGRLEAGGFLMPPQIRLRFQGYPALLKYVRAGKHATHTVFSITWPDPQFRLEIYPQDILSGFRRLWGMEDIEIGSAEFDRAYYISGNSRAAVREMLTAEVQAAVWRLAQLGSTSFGAGVRDIQVQFLGGVLTITKPRQLQTYEQVEDFIALSAELFQAALRSRNVGIEFVGDVSTAVREPDAVESQCQVCGEPLAANLVWCSACQTPHHHECWEYFGGCSTYACGNKQTASHVKKRRAS